MSKMRGPTSAPAVGDATAIGASAICLAHCLLLPLAISMIPAFSNLIEVPEAFHLVLFLFAVPVSAYAIVSGYRLHGSWLPGAIAAVGLGLIGIGAAVGLPFAARASVTVLGSLVLVIAHLRNWRAGGIKLGQAGSSITG